MSKVKALQKPILDALSKSVGDSLKQFLPNVKNVDIGLSEARRYEAMRRAEILVDDGTPTELRYKGDGVQSLAAIALLRFAASAQRGTKDVILALEEPESHLHPNAIRELHDVLRSLADKQQVVITTHCGLFVDRENPARNVIVQGGQARAAHGLDDIRSVLGIRPSDNLQHAEYVLVTEGEDDRLSLSAILGAQSTILKNAIKKNRLAIDAIGGAGKLSYKLGLLRDALCPYICFLDDDVAGRNAVESAKTDRLIDGGRLVLARLGHLDETEFEDLLNDQLIRDVLEQKWGLASIVIPPKFHKKKWSDRIRAAFAAAGKPWDDGVEKQVKLDIVSSVVAEPDKALRAATAGPINNLVALLEKKLAKNDA